MSRTSIAGCENRRMIQNGFGTVNFGNGFPVKKVLRSRPARSGIGRFFPRNFLKWVLLANNRQTKLDSFLVGLPGPYFPFQRRFSKFLTEIGNIDD